MKRTCGQKNCRAYCIIDLSRRYCRAAELKVIGPDLSAFPKLSVTPEDGSLLITTNGKFHLHGSNQINSGDRLRQFVSGIFWLAQQLAQSTRRADLFHRSGSPLAPGRDAAPERPGQTPTPSR